MGFLIQKPPFGGFSLLAYCAWENALHRLLQIRLIKLGRIRLCASTGTIRPMPRATAPALHKAVALCLPGCGLGEWRSLPPPCSRPWRASLTPSSVASSAILVAAD